MPAPRDHTELHRADPLRTTVGPIPYSAYTTPRETEIERWVGIHHWNPIFQGFFFSWFNFVSSSVIYSYILQRFEGPC